MTTVGEQVGVAVGDGSGVGVAGEGAGVSVGRADVGVGGTGVSVGGPGVTVGHGVGHGCAPKETDGSDAITNKATVSEMARFRKRIASLPFASRQAAGKCNKMAWVGPHTPQTN